MVTERLADMRLEGQMHEISVPLPDGPITDATMPAIRAAFATAYAERYTSVYAGVGIMAISFRVRCRGPLPQLSLTEAGARPAGAARKGTRAAWFDGGFVDTPVYDRYALAPGARIAGPAIIEEREATTIIPPGDSVSVDATGTLAIDIGLAAAPVARVTAETPIEQAAALIEADPVSLEIMWSRLVTVVEEMWHTICRTAFSLIVSEAQDFACDLLDARGDSLAHSPRAMPVFNLTLPRAVKALLEKFPPETLKPGDVLVTNDPWLCAGHLFDIAVVTPVFRNGALVALTGTVGHVGDIGGTKDSLRAREIYEEGIQIPPMMLYRAGVPNEDLFTLIAENVRKSEEVLGDIHSFIAANALGAERLLAFMDEYGMHDLRALARVVQTRAESAMRDAIRALPDGVYHSEIWNNPLGREAALSAEAHRAGRRDRTGFRRRAGATAARRAELHLQLHRGARDLSDEVHPQPAGAQQRRLLSAVHREGAGGLDPELHQAGVGEPAHARRLVHRAQHLPRARRCGAGAGAGRDRAAGRDQHLRPRGERHRLCRPFLHGRRPGRIAARRRQVRAAVSDLGCQHVGRTDGSARTGAGAGEILRHRFRRPRQTSRRLRRAHAAAQAVRRRTADVGIGVSGRRRRHGAKGCTAACRAAACAAWCSIPTATWCTIAAPANWSH